MLEKIKTHFRHRSEMRVRNTLGLIRIDTPPKDVYRDSRLEHFDAYYENRQYDSLPSWDQAQDANGQHISVRKRKPRLKVPFAKTLAQRLTAKLVGESVFPSFVIPDSPDDTEFIKAVVRESNIKNALIEPVRRMVNTGSVFIRFYIVAGTIKLEWFSSKYCYPTFQPNGELESVTIKYLFSDPEEKDENGNPKRKWFRMDLGRDAEILFDNPEYKEDQEPEFNEVERVEHGLGFVQGEWGRIGDTSGEDDSIDGYGLCCDLHDFIDELNYSLSQSSQAVGYNQDPQLTIKGMDEEEMASLIRSVTKSWNLGRNGEASFLEAGMEGVKVAMELRDKVRLNIQDLTRIVLLDPEKIVGSAQSAKAMEVLHGPLKELVDELRPIIARLMKNLVLKMAVAILAADRQGIETPIILPPGYVPTSLNLELDWPPIFQQTMEDLQKKVGIASQAKNSGLISPETALRYIAKDFGIENIEEELAKIDEAAAKAAALNPFGGF
jgi:hypothetical protein